MIRSLFLLCPTSITNLCSATAVSTVVCLFQNPIPLWYDLVDMWLLTKVEPYGHNFESNDPKAVLSVEFCHILLVAKWINDGPKAIIDNPTEFSNEFLFHIQSPLNSSMQEPQGPSCHSTSLPNPDGTGSLTPIISTGNVSLIIGLMLSTLLHIAHAIISLIPFPE